MLSLGAARDASQETIWRPNAHIPQLDGIRGLAILLVTLYRFGRAAPDDSSTGSNLALLFQCGEHGVELFFVLSGFLITGILIESKHAVNYLSSFMARRALRIFPLYFATLIVVLWIVPAVAAILHCVHPFEAAQSQQIYLWSYSTNIAMSLQDSWMFGWLDHFWSLAVEEHFYLLWPLVVLACTGRQLLWFSIAGAALATLARIGWILADFNHTAPMVLTLFRCDGLLLGAAMAVLIRNPEFLGLNEFSKRCASWIWVPAMLMAIIIDLSQRRLCMFGESLWTIAWCSLLWNAMSATRSSWQSALFELPWLRFLGKISYGMYVFQNPLIPIMVPCLWMIGLNYGSEGRVLEHLICMMLMCAITVLCAWISWHAFEKHWLRWKVLFATSCQRARSEEADLKLPTTMLRIGG